MYTLKSNNVAHELLEKNDIKIELISNLTPYNINDTASPVDSNFMDVNVIKNKYDILLLNLYFTDSGYGRNKILGNCVYPISLFDDLPVESDYKGIGFMTADYISADSTTEGNSRKYSVSLTKTGPDKILARCTASDVEGSLYGIKL
jgi:hypothetical protein|nr:MAG TPA: hypothetical protein [Caudoviricetes sp.]